MPPALIPAQTRLPAMIQAAVKTPVVQTPVVQMMQQVMIAHQVIVTVHPVTTLQMMRLLVVMILTLTLLVTILIPVTDPVRAVAEPCPIYTFLRILVVVQTHHNLNVPQ
jgi:hypothetical protein